MQYAGSQYNGAGYASQPSHGFPGQYYQNQPQPIQHQYSGQQQQYVSTPYAGTVPFPQPSSYDAPSIIHAAPSQPPVHRPPRTQTPHPHRRHTTTGTGSGSARPLRPAIKKKQRISSLSANGTVPVAAPILRTRTQSGAAEPQSRIHSIIRTRTNSSSRVDPGAHTANPLFPLHLLTAASLLFCPLLFFSIQTTFSCP